MQYVFPYWGPLVMLGQIEKPFIDLLLKKGNVSRKKNLDNRSKLAGMIDNEYYYKDYQSWFIPQFTPYMNLYNEVLQSTWKPDQESSPWVWTLSNLWINYQKANDYNPPHDHTGALSFVIYLQVPDEIKKEYKRMVGVHNNSGPGAINFNYGVRLPFSINTYQKFPEVGDLYIFPAWLTHFVHAFKSDVERISVSGNIELKDDKI